MSIAKKLLIGSLLIAGQIALVEFLCSHTRLVNRQPREVGTGRFDPEQIEREIAELCDEDPEMAAIVAKRFAGYLREEFPSTAFAPKGIHGPTRILPSGKPMPMVILMSQAVDLATYGARAAPNLINWTTSENSECRFIAIQALGQITDTNFPQGGTFAKRKWLDAIKELRRSRSSREG